MPMRLGPGPVFVYEWLTASRRWQPYAVRAGYVGAILVGLAFVSHEMIRSHFPGPVISLQELAAYGQSMHLTIAAIGLAMVLLTAPATTAGAVCLDKARGTLDHTLVTDLSDAEIVLGKLGVRLIPVLGLIACTLPVLALVGLLGGVEPMAIVGSFLTAIGCAVLGCSLAMTLSVWGRKTHEVLMATYMIIVAWLGLPVPVALVLESAGGAPPPAVAPAFWQAVVCTNPIFLVCAPYTEPGRVGLGTFVGFLGGCLAASAGLIGLSTARIRSVAQRQAGRPSAGPRRRRLPRWRRPRWLPPIPGPSLDDNPVAWREWHHSRPSPMFRTAWGLYAAAGAIGALWILAIRPGPFADGVGMVVAFQVGLGLLLLSVGAATSLAEERARGSLDVLLSTPMSTHSILVGKWWGNVRRAWRVAFWPAVLGAMVLADTGKFFHYVLLLGSIAAYVAAIASLGLATATRVGRPGRAVAACVAVYVAGSFGWAGLIVLLFRPEPMGRSMIIGCPALGALAGTIMIAPHHLSEWAGEYRFAATFWIGVYLAIAAGLFGATVRGFDRCLGRMPEDGSPTRRPAGSPRWNGADGRGPLGVESWRSWPDVDRPADEIGQVEKPSREKSGEPSTINPWRSRA